MPEDKRDNDASDESVDEQPSNPLEAQKLPLPGAGPGRKELPQNSLVDNVPPVVIDEEDMSDWN